MDCAPCAPKLANLAATHKRRMTLNHLPAASAPPPASRQTPAARLPATPCRPPWPASRPHTCTGCSAKTPSGERNGLGAVVGKGVGGACQPELAGCLHPPTCPNHAARPTHLITISPVIVLPLAVVRVAAVGRPSPSPPQSLQGRRWVWQQGSGGWVGGWVGGGEATVPHARWLSRPQRAPCRADRTRWPSGSAPGFALHALPSPPAPAATPARR